MNGSTEVTASDRVQLTDENKTLNFTSVSRYDQGLYRCHVSNPVSHSISETVNITVNCEVNLTPRIFASVFIQIFSNLQTTLMTSRLTDGNSTLTIANVSRYDQGPFRCFVSNAVSSGSSDPVNISVSLNGQDTTTSFTGSNITLSCSAESRPPAIIQWIFNGAPLNHSGKELTLENLTLSHSGVYQCLLHNTVTGRYNSVNIFISAIAPLLQFNFAIGWEL
uniref:Ig-like domain-containing protein n=1 Tax=Gouania willdenowi TaxID=441366 RepID=A0A8C5EP38_GOUWI